MKPVRLEEKKTVYDLAAGGMTGYAISKETGVRENDVYRWLKSPEKYSPYLDEIAIERSLQGDRKVFDALSQYEKYAFWNRAYVTARKHWLAGDGSENPWVANIADLLGMKPKSFSKHIDNSQRT